MEIFDHWWEYFLVMWWGISPPDLNKYFGPDPGPVSSFRDDYYDSIKSLSTSRVKFLLTKTNRIEEQENKTTEIIENKAHSIISQSGLVITLLAIAISFFTTQYDGLRFNIFNWLSLILILIILNLITAALLAKNVLVTKYTYIKSVIKDVQKDSNIIDTIVEQICIVEHTAYINIVKATFLQFAHWYFKITLILILLFVLSLPVFYAFSATNNDIEEVGNTVNRKTIINNYLESDTLRARENDIIE